MLRELIPTSDVLSSVTLERGLFMVTGAIVSALGVGAAVFVLALPRSFVPYASLFFLTVAALLFFSAIVLRRRVQVLSGTARFIGRLPWFATWIEKRCSSIYSVEQKVLGFHRDFPRAERSAGARAKAREQEE